MSLGVCCHWLDIRTTPRSGKIVEVNLLEEKVLQLGQFRSGNYTHDKILSTYKHNLTKAIDVLNMAADDGVSVFRLSSSLLPLADQVDRSLWDNDVVKGILEAMGKVVTDRNIRLTTHPGQFCVISSDSDAVIRKSIVELEMHAWLFDMMNLPKTQRYAINIHGGKSDRVSKLCEIVATLTDSVRGRLTFENDETCYNVRELLQVHEKTGVPIVFDSHHHTFNEGDMSMADAIRESMATWGSIKPLQHISNTEPDLVGASVQQRRKHSKMIHYVPTEQLELLRQNVVDCDVEAKSKQIAVRKLAADFNIPM